MSKQYSTVGPRAIYPEMCASPSLGRCGVMANLLFPRLVAQADDQGRLAGGANAIMVHCLPRMLETVTVGDVDQALAELHEAGMLVRYVVQGDPYLQLAGWWRWQSSMRRAYPSRWPAPKGWRDLVYGTDPDVPATLKDLLRTQTNRNAAVRGILPQPAARASGASAPAKARGVPDRAVPNRTVPPGAGEPPAPDASGAGSGGRFRDKVPPPPGHRSTP